MWLTRPSRGRGAKTDSGKSRGGGFTVHEERNDQQETKRLHRNPPRSKRLPRIFQRKGRRYNGQTENDDHGSDKEPYRPGDDIPAGRGRGPRNNRFRTARQGAGYHFPDRRDAQTPSPILRGASGSSWTRRIWARCRWDVVVRGDRVSAVMTAEKQPGAANPAFPCG